MKKSKKIAAIIQARLGSTRLPNKVLLPLGDTTVIEWVVDRASLSFFIDEVIVAIPDNEENIKLWDFLKQKKIMCSRWKGDEEDVLSRVLFAADEFKIKTIVDITADCPMIDPRHINHIIELKRKHNADYASNVIGRTWPDGLDIQVYDTDILQYVKEKYNPKHHVGWNIQSAPEFKLVNYPAPKDFNWPELGLTLDTNDDYTLLSHLFKIFGRSMSFYIEDVINYLKNNNALVEINNDVVRKTPEEG